MKTLAILLIAVFGLAHGRFLLEEEIPVARLFSLVQEAYQEKRAANAIKVTIDPVFNGLYRRMLSSRKKYAILKINNENKLVIDSMEESDDTTTMEEDEKVFNKMKAALPEDQPRYILYKFDFDSDLRGIHVKKIVFIYWDPTKSTGLQRKLKYKLAKDAVTKALSKDLYKIKFSDAKFFTYAKMVQRVQWLV